MRVLVTGHEGYLGSVLVPRFLAAGHEVVGLDTGLFADCVIGPVPEPVPALRVDLRDVTEQHLKEVAPDAVVHLAALCNDPLGNALLAGDGRLRSNGMAWRPLVHADDIASAFLALLEAPRETVHARAFNVGDSNENYLIRDVAQLVHEIVGGEVTFAEGAGADARNYRVSCDRIAREVPAFRPRWTLRTGIEQLAEAYQRHGLTLDALMGERHQRLRRINALLEAGALDGSLRWTEAV